MLHPILSRGRRALPHGLGVALIGLLGCDRAGDTTQVMEPVGSDTGAAPSTAQADAALPAAPTVLSDGRRVIASGKPTPAAECASDADCGDSAGQCSEIVPGGIRMCIHHPAEATEPSAYMSGMADECDATRPCAEGRCYLVTFFFAGVCPVGAELADLNRCRADECASDADCAGGICAPRGFPVEGALQGGDIRSCLPARCRSNTDCNAEPGGVCAVIDKTCSEPVDRFPGRAYRPKQLACVYANGCTGDADCPIGTCTLSDGRAVCAAANVSNDCSGSMPQVCPTSQIDSASPSNP